MEQAVEAVNNASVDLIFLTGDYVDHWYAILFNISQFKNNIRIIKRPRVMGALAEKYLKRLKSKYGIYASLGNHDHQQTESQHLVLTALKKVGIRTLINEAAHPIPNHKND